MSDAIPALAFVWEGDLMRPLAPKLADKHYVVGEKYRLVPHEERSASSHAHFFASVAEAWGNLPEHLAERFVSSEHLRKFALIKAGYRDERSIVAASKAEAQRMAAFIKPLDDFAVVAVTEAVVTVYTAKSQSMKAMGKATFQDSKEKVLQVLADMAGVTPDELKRNAEEVA